MQAFKFVNLSSKWRARCQNMTERMTVTNYKLSTVTHQQVVCSFSDTENNRSNIVKASHYYHGSAMPQAPLHNDRRARNNAHETAVTASQSGHSLCMRGFFPCACGSCGFGKKWTTPCMKTRTSAVIVPKKTRAIIFSQMTNIVVFH